MTSIRFIDVARTFMAKTGIPARDLLPLIPPDAKLGATSNVKPHQLGKIPGRFSGGFWYGLSGPWPTFGLSENDSHAAALWPTHNVGLRAADYPGIDCDVNSVEALRLVEELINVRLAGGSLAPVRERGNAPRALFVFRRVGDDPVRKIRVVFEDDKGVTHAVEVLGLGQQYVIAGMHPSGVAYEWREGRDLAQTEGELIPMVTAEKLSGFMADLCREVENKGWKITTTISPRYGTGGEGMGILVNNADPLVEPKLALGALQAIPNNEETLPSREDLVAVCASFKHMLGRDSDAYYGEFVKWASRYNWADEEYVKPIWDSLTSVRTSPDYLFRLARRHGFRGDALADFAEYRDDSADSRIQVVRQQVDEQTLALQKLAEKVVYYPGGQEFYVLDTGEALSPAALNSYPGLGTGIAPAGATGVRTAANMLINSGLLRTVMGRTYYPGKDKLVKMLVRGREVTLFNNWRATGHPLPTYVTDKDVQPWLDHVAYLVPDQRERETLLDFLAHVVQRRGEKVRWAPLIVGRQGTGKDVMLKPISKFLTHDNYIEIKPEDLMARFNSYLENELIVVEEMVRFEKAEVYNQIKVMLSGSSGDRLSVERKHKERYEIENRVNFVFFSNNPDAVRMDDDDRRFFVISSPAEKRDSAYYKFLIEEFYDNQSGWRKVIRWLLQRDVSKLDTNHPIETSAKLAMIEVQRNSLHVTLREELRDGFYKDRTVLSATEVMQTIKTDFNFPIDNASRNRISNSTEIARILRAAGWHYYDRGVKMANRVPINLWVRDREMLDKAPRELRALWEKETGKGEEAAA